MKRSISQNTFELEMLEERILLSADSLLGGLPAAAPDNIKSLFDVNPVLPPLEEVLLAETTCLQQSSSYASDPYDPSQNLEDIFSGLTEEDYADDMEADSSEPLPYEDSSISPIQKEEFTQGLQEFGRLGMALEDIGQFNTVLPLTDNSSMGGGLGRSEILDTRLSKPVYDYFNDAVDPPGTEGLSHSLQGNSGSMGEVEFLPEGGSAPAASELQLNVKSKATCDGEVCLQYLHQRSGNEFVFSLTGGPAAVRFRLGSSAGVFIDATTRVVLARIEAAENAIIQIRGQDNIDDQLIVELEEYLPNGMSIEFDGGEAGFDSLVLIGNESLGVSYTAMGSDAGLIHLTSPVATGTIKFAGLEPVTISGVEEYTFVTDGGSDAIVIDSPAEGQNRITGTSDGTSFESVTFFDVGSVTIDTAANDLPGNDSDTITIDSSGLVASGLENFTIITGSGDDTVTIEGLSADSAVVVSGGSGHDTLIVDSQDGLVSFGENRISVSGFQSLSYDVETEVVTLTGIGSFVTEGGDNGSLAKATPLDMVEDPAGGGYFSGRGLGSINPSSDHDYWSFEALAGDVVSIAVDTLGSGLDPYLRLRNSANSSLKSEGYSGPDSDAFISAYQISSSGIYYVEVYENSYYNNTTGSYQVRVDVARSIQLESDANYSNDSISGANVLKLTAAGTDQVGTIAGTIMLSEGNNLDEDVFSLGTLSAGNQVVLEVVLPSTSTLLPRVRLINGSGAVVSDIDGDTFDGRFEGVIPADGAYYAKVESQWAYGGHRYLLTGSTSWAAAEASAQSLGGHLVTINDAGEQQWVAANFSRLNGVWLGLNDSAVEGSWVWADGAPVSYTAWASGEPNSGGSYDYAIMNSNGLWYDGYNGSNYRGLVELEDSEVVGSAGPGPWGQYLLAAQVSDVVAPRVVSVSGLPAEGGSTEAVVDVFTVKFSEDLSAATVNGSGGFDLRAAGVDGLFDTADDVIYSLSVSPAYSTGTTVRLFINGGPLEIGYYRFTVTGAVSDRVGNPLDGNGDGVGSDDYVHTFELAVPEGVVLEGRDNGSLAKATPLVLIENPAGRGYFVGRGLGSINPVSDHDYWSFEALAGDVVSIAVDTLGSGLDPYLRLRNSGNTVLISDSYSGPDSDAFISAYRISSSGIYYVEVYENSYYHNTTGSYRLRLDVARSVQLESDGEYANDSISGADKLTLEEVGSHQTATVVGTLMAPQGSNFDEDVFGLGLIPEGNTILARLVLPGGSTLRPVIEIRDWNNQVRSVNPNPVDGSIARVDISEAGNYYAMVVAFDGHGDYGQYLLDITIAPSAEFNFADLSVTDISGPGSAESGGSVELSWTVGNFGTAATESELWVDRVIMSANELYGDGDDLYIASVPHSGVLAVDETYTVTASLQLPKSISGSYWFFVKADGANQVTEFNLEDNNVIKSSQPVSVALTPYGDLTVTELQSGSVGAAGAPFTVSWQVTNRGTGTTGDGTPGGAVSEWVDGIVFSPNGVFGDGDDVWIAQVAHNGSLAPEDAYSGSWSGELPTTLSGKYYLMVYTDHGDGVYEYRDLESNLAVKGAQIDVAPSLFADLSVSAPRGPPEGIVGQEITVAWTVTNTSNAWRAASESWWFDSVILSGDTISGNNDDLSLGRFRHDGVLEIGESYEGSGTVTLPGGLEGTYYLFVLTDSDGQVYEFNYEDNNSGGPLAIEITGPDLVVHGITDAVGSATFGERLAISWTVRNAGGAGTEDSWSDSLWLSTDNVLSTDDTFLTAEAASTPLLSGQTYDGTATCQLPLSPSFPEGTYYIIVKTDSLGDQAETDETNNFLASQPITLILPPLPDLVVSQVAVNPAVLSDGQTVTLSAQVQNRGPGDSTSEFFVRFEVDDAFIGHQKISWVVASGEDLVVEQPWQVPVGEHTIRVLVDETDAVFESDEGNNLLALDLAEVEGADLAVAELSWTPETITDSDTVTFAARVANLGAHTLRDFAVRFEIDGFLLTSATVSGGLAAGAETAVAGSWAARPGDHLVTVVVDSGGTITETNEDNNSAAHNLPTIVDETPPTFIRFSPVHQSKVHDTVLLQMVASDAVGVAKYIFELSSDGDNWNAIGEAATGSISWDTSLLTDGEYLIRFTAQDLAGNKAVQTAAYVVDNTAPSPVVLSAEPGEFSVILRWSESGAADFAYYKLYRSTAADSGYTRINGLMSTETFTDRAVSPGITYWYQVTVVDHVGNESGFSDPASASPVSDSTPPTILSLLPAEGKRAADVLELSVRATDNVGVTRYVFAYSRDGETWQEIATGGASTVDWDVKGIEGGSYQVRVTAADAFDNGSSLIQTYVVDHTGPDAPTPPRVTAEEVLLVAAWDPVVSFDFHHYELSRSTAGDPFEVILAATTSTVYMDRQVTPGTVYSYRVVAVDDLGNRSIASQEVSGQPLPDTTAPLVRSLSPAEGSQVTGQITLTATAVDNVRVHGFVFEFAPADSENWQVISEDSAPTEISVNFWRGEVFWDTNSLAQGEYRLRVSAVDFGGNPDYLIHTLMVDHSPPEAPAAPLVQDPRSGGQLTLSWTAVSAPDVAGYKVYRSETSGAGFTQVATIDTLQYSDSGLVNGLTYFYVLAAIDRAGNISGFSEEGGGTPTAEADLAVGAISFNPDSPVLGREATIAVSILNHGPAAATADVGFYLGDGDSGLLLTIATVTATANSTVLVTCPWTPQVAGVQTVEVRIESLTGTDTTPENDRSSAQAIVNIAPVAEAGGDRQGEWNSPIGFNGTGSHDGDGLIAGYLWDFGDGTTDGHGVTSHTYLSPGTYTATLRVTDNRGASAVDTCAVKVDDTRADLVIADLTWTPVDPQERDEVTITATIGNQGNGPTLFGFFTTFYIDGVYAGYQRVNDLLDAGTNLAVTFNWTATKGLHTLEVVVDDIQNNVVEIDEGNNTAGTALTLQQMYFPDLMISNLTSDISDLEVSSEKPLVATAAVTNLGAADAFDFWVSLYLDNELVARQHLPELVVAATQNVTFQFLPREGSHTLFAVVDDPVSQVLESDESNNGRFLALPAVTVAYPDLTVEDIRVLPAETILSDGTSFDISGDIRNLGSVDSEHPFKVSFYLDGQYVGDREIRYLPAGAVQTVALQTRATAGTHLAEVVVDQAGAIAEADEVNNRGGYDIAEITMIYPDLMVSDVQWLPLDVTYGKEVDFTCTVSNTTVVSTSCLA
ncbi:MAG: CARDB domain-containing protein [Gammaproteobacteria bacterium]